MFCVCVHQMPKKYKGLNSKAVEAKERKSVAKALEDKRKQQDVENAHWADDDKHVARKQQRKVAHCKLCFMFTSLNQSIKFISRSTCTKMNKKCSLQ